MSTSKAHDNDLEKKTDLMETDEELEYQCGYFSCTPKWLQRFNTPPWLVACMMVLMFTQGFVVNGVKNVNTSTLERRYELTSGQVAWLSTSYEIGAGLLAVTFGYLGTFMHKGRIIAASTTIMGAGSLTMAAPHLAGGAYQVGGLDVDLCDVSGNTTDTCGGDSTSQRSFLGVFIAGQLLHAVGGAAIYTLSVPYIDENVSRRDSTFYIGCMLAMAVFGPGLGFIIGGLCLQIYVDVGRVDMDE